MINNISEKKHIILTLDAGGTNMVFSAIRGGEEVVNPIELKTSSDDLESIINSMIRGFGSVIDLLKEKPSAISFAFPGPADYPNGIIGELPNLPAFRGGVALKSVLEDKFNLPVFVNNDGDLFAYGEAIAGFLPEINESLSKNNNIKRYNNLIGITLGTGFGGGVVKDKELFIGDNSNSGEIWSLRDSCNPESFIEESISIRAIVRNFYHFLDKDPSNLENPLSPKEIYKLSQNGNTGEKEAAKYAFERYGMALGEAIANIVTIIDGLVVIGGGISKAYDLFIPACMDVLNGKMKTYDGELLPRLPLKFYNAEENAEKQKFLMGAQKTIQVPLSNKKITYDAEKRIALGKTVLGTNKAIAIGAYAYAINQLNAIHQYVTY